MRAAGGESPSAPAGGLAAAYEMATLRMAARVAAEEAATVAARASDLADEVAEQREAFRGLAGRLATVSVDLSALETAAHWSHRVEMVARLRAELAQLRQVCVLRGEP